MQGNTKKTKVTVLDKAIDKALAFVEEKHDGRIGKSSCVKVGVYVHRPQPPLQPLGISYLITLRKDENGRWQYAGHHRHIPSIDYARVVNVEPIIHYCE